MREEYRYVVARINRFQLLRRLRIQQFYTGTGLYFGQMPLLAYVGNNPGCTQHEAAEATGVSEPSVATSVKRMIKSGMLSRQADEDNLRCNRLFLTERGRAEALAVRERFEELDTEIFRGFTDEQIEFFCRMLDRMTEAVADGEPAGIEPEDIGRLRAKVFNDEKKKRQAVDG